MGMFESLKAIVNLTPVLRFTNTALFPPTCCLCGAAGTTPQLDLCAICERALPRDVAGSEAALRLTHVSAVIAPLAYRFPVDELIHALKYRGDRAPARVLAALIAQRVRARSIAAGGVALPELLVPVPLHPARRRERGFNQAALIARHVGRELSVRVAARATERLLATRSQTALGPAERRQNVRRAFRVAPGRAGRVLSQVRHVAIVDDVVTTGSTADELGRVLRDEGVRRIELWVVARAATPAPLASAERGLEQHADEDGHAHVVVVEKGAKTPVGVAFANEPLLIDEEHGGAGESEQIPTVKLHALPGEVQRQ